MSDMEILKRIAEKETDRLREEMERRPRVSQETIVECSKGFGSFEKGIAPLNVEIGEAALLALSR